MLNQSNAGKATHEIPSGLGGVFNVIILEEKETACLIQIVCPQYDFHGKQYYVNKAELTKL